MKLTLALTLFFMAGFGAATAQEEIQLWDETGNPIILPNQSPAVLTLKAGEFIHGQVNQAEQVTSTLQNFMTSNSFDGTTTFQGVVPSYQTSLTIGQQQIVIMPAQADSGLPYGLTITDLILIGIVIAVVAVLAIVVKKKLENS